MIGVKRWEPALESVLQVALAYTTLLSNLDILGGWLKRGPKLVEILRGSERPFADLSCPQMLTRLGELERMRLLRDLLLPCYSPKFPPKLGRTSPFWSFF